jgi:hypothetical protein
MGIGHLVSSLPPGTQEHNTAIPFQVGKPLALRFKANLARAMGLLRSALLVGGGVYLGKHLKYATTYPPESSTPTSPKLRYANTA